MTGSRSALPAADTVRTSPMHVFAVFLKLGLTSFGGPIAHLGYFRREFVERRRWLDDGQYAQLMALCQFLPGPASSQLGFAIGLLRAGGLGALAAFVGFTLPSALLLVAFAAALPYLSGQAGAAAVHGLKLVALAVVAYGVLGMARHLCPDAERASIAAGAAAIMLVVGEAWAQLALIGLGAVAGLLVCRPESGPRGAGLVVRYGPRMGWAFLAAFAVLLAGLPAAAAVAGGFAIVADAFYRAGALVFGGGHVVLPLLEEMVVGPGWVAQEEFLAGYGAAQAVPGPMFSLAAYLGARMSAPLGGPLGAAVALLAIFLPGFLLIAGILPLWRSLVDRPRASKAIAGVNAAVVGLLGAALYDPVWTSAVRGPADVGIALIGFVLLAAWRLSPLVVVGWCVGASVVAGTLLAPATASAQESPPHIGYGVRGGPMATFDWHGGDGSREFAHVAFRSEDLADLEAWLDGLDRLLPRRDGVGGCADRPEAIEIGNEPNLDASYGWGAAPDAAAYSRGLCAAYRRIKARAPDVVVVSAGLAPTGRVPFRWRGHAGYCAPGVEWCPSYYQDEREFLREMLRAGAGACLDAIGYHPYGFAAPFDAERGSAACGPNDFCFRGVEAIREIAYGEFGVESPIWATEFGWLNDPRQIGLDACWESPDFEGRRWQVVSPADQARYLKGAFEFADRHYPWMGAMFVFNYNYGTACDHRCYSIAGRPAEAELQAMAKRYVVPDFGWSGDVTLLVRPGGGPVRRTAFLLENRSPDRLEWLAELSDPDGFAGLPSSRGDACTPVWIDVDPSGLSQGIHRAVVTLEMTRLPMVPIAGRTQVRSIWVRVEPGLSSVWLPAAAR